MYDMYTVTGKPGANNADTLLTGHMHKAGGYLSMDLINIFFPKAKKKIVSIHPYVGGGIAFYKRAKYYADDRYYDPEKNVVINPTHVRGNTTNYINANGEVGPDCDTTYKNLGYLQAGVNVEFNLNRTLALGVRANYSYFTRDYMDGRGYSKSPLSNASKNNDGIFDITLNMRIKLIGVHETHVRNISSYDTWEKKVEMKPVHDTVIIKHDSIIIRETYRHTETQKDIDQIYYVYFENNKSNLDDKALITIQQVAERLNEDTTLFAVITGYCDNTGSNALNYALGDRRADNVLDELVEEHAIDTARMYAAGMGKVIGRRSQAAYGPNRRASIKLVDKATFNRMKNNLDEVRSTREVEVKTVPLEESARPEKVNVYQQRGGDEITTDASTTLSKLARKYYNNTYCWVYIYIANKEKIKNPNALMPGTKLNIPELTEQEMHVTKDQSLVIYRNARQAK
jgi:outer membrane protein OmpA-like peptidoglycan-associated protein